MKRWHVSITFSLSETTIPGAAVVRSFCRGLGVPGGTCTAVCCLVWGSIPRALLWPCMPCIRPFDGPLIIPYSYNSSGFTGAFMRSVWLYLLWSHRGVYALQAFRLHMSSNTAFNTAVWLSVRRLVAFSVCLCISVWVTV